MAQANRATKSLAERVLQRQQALETDPERQQFDERTREVIQYVRSDLSQYLDDTQVLGEKRTSKIYSSMPTSLLEEAADTFCGNIFVPQGWFGYETEDRDLNKADDVQAWLQECEDHMMDVFSGSNFYHGAMPPMVMDALSLGDGITFTGYHQKEDRPYVTYCEIMGTWFIRDLWGQLICVHRRKRYTAIEAYRMWGTACSSALVADAEGEKPGNRYSFIQAVYAQDDPLLKGLRLKRKRPFVELWIQEKSDKNTLAWGQAHLDVEDPMMTGILEQSGYFTMPFCDWPYWWKSNETYGRSPLHLPSVKRLHAYCKADTIAVQRGAQPPMLGSKTLKNDLDLAPDGVTWRTDANQTLEPVYKMSLRSDQTMERILKAEDEIQDMLKLKVFMAMTLAKKDMRVDEVLQRIGEQSAALAPRIGLLNCIYLDQQHARMWRIEEDAGRIPPPPESVLRYLDEQARKRGGRYKGLSIIVRYKGPLSQAQESLFMQRRLAGGVMAIQTFQSLDPEAVADKVDVGAVVEGIMDKTGFPQDAIRSDAEFKARQEARAQAQQAQAQADVGKTQSEAFRNTVQGGKTLG